MEKLSTQAQISKEIDAFNKSAFNLLELSKHIEDETMRLLAREAMNLSAKLQITHMNSFKMKK